MWEMAASADPAAAATLVILSFVCFITGAAFRRWPEKVRELVGPLDGSLLWLTDEAHLIVITASAWVLTFLSVIALVAAAAVL